MNDDELRRQLERRAAAGRDDWVRRGLLPVVSSAIDAGSPEPFVGRGLSPVGALAAVAAVVVLVVGLALVLPPTTPVGTQSPLPSSPSVPSVAVNCHLEPLPGDPRPSVQPPAFVPRVSDATGLVEACTIERINELGPAAVRVLADQSAPGDLRVEWQGTPCDAAATLHFSGSWDDADLLVEYPDGNCDSMGVAHAVTLHMARAVDPDRVIVRAVTAAGEQQGIDWARDEENDASFELRIFSPGSTFVAGEPIEGINAELVYIGDQPEITLTGVGSLVQAFGVRQLDGPLLPGAGWDEPCVPEVIRATIPYVAPFSKSGGFDEDDPNAAWYRQYFDDPELRLPAGRWQLTAYSTFYVGGCGGRLVELEASVIIDVVEAQATPTIATSPSPGKPIEPALPTTAPVFDEVTAETTAGTFELRLEADSGVYAAGQPIDVMASLTLLGQTDDMVGGSGLSLRPTYHQVDGDLEMNGPPVAAICGPFDIGRGAPIAVNGHASRGVGYIADSDPNADFYRHWMDGDQLWLPAGTWRVASRTHFWLGGGCAGERVSLTAEVWITVVEESEDPASAGVPLLTSPPNPDGACPGAAGTGTLIPHQDSGIGLRDWHGEVWPVTWPNGFTARRTGEGIALHGSDGRLLAHEGDNIRFGGGWWPDYIYACTGIELLPAGPLPTP